MHFRLGYRPYLDGLRGIFVLLVLMLHADVPFTRGGYIGVDGFFVLSGFLITALLVQEWGRTEKIDLIAFYRRRILRLFPALLALLIACALFTLFYTTGAAAEDNWRGILSALVYVGNWTRIGYLGNWHHGLGMLDHTWSLAVEEQFYLTWPLLLAFMLSRRFAVRRIFAIAVSLLFASALLKVVLMYSEGPITRIGIGTDTRADALLAGCVVALLLSFVPFGSLTRLTAF